MSKENLEQFIQKVTDDEQLQSRLGEEIDIDSLIALGAEHGFEFTEEDLQESAELSDEELGGVAGGFGTGGRSSGSNRSTTPVDMTGWYSDFVQGIAKAGRHHVKDSGKKIG